MNVTLDCTVIRWPKYIPEPENSFLLLAEAAAAEARHWQQFYPKQNHFEIDLYVRSHTVNVGERVERRYDGVKANWHQNCVPMPLDCILCGRAIFMVKLDGWCAYCEKYVHGKWYEGKVIHVCAPDVYTEVSKDAPCARCEKCGTEYHKSPPFYCDCGELIGKGE